MTNTKSAKINLNLNKRFDDLIVRCGAWNLGAFKTANDQLYELLAETYELYLHIVNGDNDVRKKFNNLLKARKVTFQDNTPIQTRVVRLVFAIDRKRAYTYANVLRVARAHGKLAADIADWIRDAGGVQEVANGTGKPTTAAKAKEDAEFASDAFAKSPAVADLGKLPDILKPGQASHPTYSIALIRSEGGSTGEIVWGTDNATLITRALAMAGKDLRAKKDDDAKATTERKAKTDTVAAVKKAAKSALGKMPNRASLKLSKPTRPAVQATKLAA